MPAQPAGAKDAARTPRGGRASTPADQDPQAERERPRLPWMDAFLAALRESGVVKQAARAAGIAASTAYAARSGRYPGFTAEWDAATPGRTHARDDRVAEPGPAARHPHWRPRFLAALAETSNVAASAAQAGVDPAMVYRTRRSDPDFAAKWQEALFEGYEHLELEVLCHLRTPNPERKLDVAAALRLLAAHREQVNRLRALAGEEDEAAVRQSIDVFLEGMRQRRLANEAILIEARAPGGDEGEGEAPEVVVGEVEVGEVEVAEVEAPEVEATLVEAGEAGDGAR